MSTQICNPCAEGQVCLDNLDRYSLQDDVYYFVLNCPPNFFCGGNNTMYLVCCDGTIEQTTFTAGMTAAQRQAAISALVARCLMKDAFCTGTDTDPNNGDGTNGRPGTDPNDPLQLYGNRPMSSTSYCADGSPFTYTVPAGLFFARSQSAADTAARNFARTLSSSLKICLTGPLRTCCNNVAYSSTMVASGGVPGNFRWSVSGSLPTGLVAIPFGNNGLRIQGIPTTNGNFTFTVRATDSAGNFMAKIITIKVWGITDVTLPDGTLAADYDYQLTTTNGTAPYVYTLVGGGFPLGVDITSSGLITGVVGEEGSFSPQIKVTDHAGRTCTKTLTLNVPSACTSPAPVTFTLPLSPDKTFANTTYLFENMAAIGTSQLMFTFSTDTALRCMDIVDFTAAPVLTLDFLMNAEAGWQYRGGIYDPASGLIAAVVSKPATLDRIAFFNPVTGYVDSVELATTTPDTKRWEAVLMRGVSGGLAFYRGSFFAGDSAYIVVVNAVTKTITNTFTLASPAPDIRGDGDFCYGCANDEFYLVGSVALGHMRLYAINATTGVQRAAYDLTVLPLPGYHCAWIDSTEMIALSRPPTFMQIINPLTGSVTLTRDLDDGTIYDTVGLDNLVKYNFKLNAIMVAITFYELPGSTNPGTGFLLLNPTDLSVLDKEKVYAFFANSSPLGMSAEGTGDIYLQYNENGTDYPFKQIRPVIA